MMSNQTEDIPSPFPMPVEYIRNIFQIDNEHVYFGLDAEMQKDLIKKWRAMLVFMSSKFESHFTEDIHLTQTEIQIIEEPNGSCIATAEYCTTNPESGETEQRLAILFFAVLDVKTDDGQIFKGVKPYFSLNGIVTNDGGFTPEEAFFRTTYAGKEELCGVDNPEEFLAAICYGEAALESIILQRSPDIDKCQSWISCLNFENGGLQIWERFDYLSLRNARFMTAQMLEVFPNDDFDPHNINHHPAPPTPQ